MSKKLIAVAAAAALALTGLVAAPAQASALTFSIKGAVATAVVSAANTALTPITHAAPEFNRFDYSDTDTTMRPTNTVVRFQVTGVNNQVISVTAAGGVKILSSLTNTATPPASLKPGVDGVESRTFTAVTGTLTDTFFAYSTSTTPGTVTISATGNTSVFYVASRAGTAYNVTATEFPAAVTPDGATASHVFTSLTDVFGNLITLSNSTNQTAVSPATNIAFTATTGRLSLAAIGASVATANTWTWDTSKLKWKSTAITATPAQAGTVALRLDLDADFYDNGLPRPVTSVFSTSSGASLAAQVTTLTAQVTTLTAQVTALTAQVASSRAKDKSVTKKKFNTLARKWNAANPSARVALKK